MNEALTQKLAERFPKTFKQLGGSPQETCMAFGIECGDGWFTILDILLRSIHESGHSSWASVELDDPADKESRLKYDTVEDFWIVAHQIKEKFGTLRFYYGIGTTEAFQELAKKWPNTAKRIVHDYQTRVDAMIEMAEMMSTYTCEATGQPGELHSAGGWYRVLNREYAQTLNRGYKPVTEIKS